MKKLFVFLLIPVLLFSGCSSRVTGTDVSLTTIRNEMIEKLGAESPLRLDGDTLYLYYGIEPDVCSEFAAFVVPGATFSEEIILCKAKDEAAANTIRGLLETYLTNIRGQTKNYDPAGYAVAEKCRVETDGLYVWLLLSARAQELNTLFQSHRKGYAPEAVPVYTPEPTATPAPTPEPTPTPSPAPSDAPLPTATPAPTPVPYGLVPESEPVEDAWFDDALIIGNSVAHNLDTYVTQQRLEVNPTCMGKAIFFAGDYYSAKNAATHTGDQPYYNGQYPSVEELIQMTGAKKVYLVLAHVDLIFLESSFEEAVADAETVVRRIQDNVPDVTIYVCSMTPRNAIMEVQEVNSRTIPVYNQMLLEMTERMHCYYLDCYTPLCNENGFLPDEYTAEYTTGGMHLTYPGCKAWLDYLYRHTVS